jgi:hypothetical protein
MPGDDNPLEDHAHRWMLLGHVVELAASLETWTCVLLAGLEVGPNEDERARVRLSIEGQTISEVLKRLSQAAHTRHAEQATLITAFVRDVGAAMKRRNQLVHSVVIQPGDDTPLRVRRARAGRRPLTHDLDQHEYDDAIAILRGLLARLHGELAPALGVDLWLPPGPFAPG